MLPQKIYDETPTNKKEKKEQQTSPYLVTATESTCVLVPKITQYLASPLICVDYWVSVSQ